MEISWNNISSINETDYTNSSNLLNQFPKKTATNGTYIQVDVSGNFIYIGNTDASQVRVVVASTGTETTTISSDTNLTEDTWYQSVEVSDGYSLTLSDGASLYMTDGVVIYDSGVQSVNNSKFLEFGCV